MYFPVYVEDLRKEVRFLRIHEQQLQRAHQKQKGLNKLQQEEIKKLKKEKRQLEKQIEKLKQEIERYGKTQNRYQIALFDHGNFKHTHGGKKKPKGGQKGHPDTNRETHEDYKTYEHKRVFAKTCGECGSALTRVNSIRSKMLLDIVIHPEIIKLIIESERQW